MSEPVLTLDGWYNLQDFRRMDWVAWREQTTPTEREEIISEWKEFLQKLEDTQSEKKGSHALYSIVGQKADWMLMILRPTLEELNELENEFNKLQIAKFTIPTYSYVSVVELSNYLAKESNEDPYQNPYVRSRLYPELPKTKYVCFYPMDKRRQGDDNWYMLPMDTRRELMRSHGMIGRKYAGKVKQIICGSTGLDDHEWGVTLFSDDALQFKKIVYEMRFDEASARYGEFGSFFVGIRLDDLEQFLSI